MLSVSVNRRDRVMLSVATIAVSALKIAQKRTIIDLFCFKKASSLSKKNTSSSSLQQSSSSSLQSSLSSSCSSRLMESSSSTSQHVLHQVSETTTTSSSSSSELQNSSSELLEQVQLQKNPGAGAGAGGCGGIVGDAVDVHTERHCPVTAADGVGAPCSAADAADHPLVTFPESPPVLISKVSPLLQAQPAAHPKPVRMPQACAANGGQFKYGGPAERHVSSTSKVVKEEYEASSSSSSSSCSSTVSDSQDVLQSLHHADLRKLHAANAIRARLTGTMAERGADSSTALNKLQVRNRVMIVTFLLL